MESNLKVGNSTNENIVESKKLNVEGYEDLQISNLVKIKLNASSKSLDIGYTFTYEIVIENFSDIGLFNVNITQKLQPQLELVEVILDSKSLNIKNNVDRHNKYLTIYIDEIKAQGKSCIDIIVKLTSTINNEKLRSEAKLEAFYMDGERIKKIALYSEEYNVKVIEPRLCLVKKSRTFETIVGEAVRFTIIAENKGNVDVDNLTIIDMLNGELRFLNHTIKVDGVRKVDDNIISGVKIGTLKIGQCKEVVFEAEIISKPINEKISGKSLAKYQYNLMNEEKVREGNAESNEISIKVKLASLNVDKTANLYEASLGDEIIYKINIQNNGTSEIKNILVREDINENFTLIEDFLTLDNQLVNNVELTKGILIGDLNIGESKVITYKVKCVKTKKCKRITNTTVVNFAYKLTSGLIFKGSEIKKELDITTRISNFKSISIEDEICKDINQPQIESIENLMTEVEILQYHIVKTIEGKSNEGQISTGCKLVVQGRAKEIIEYTSNEENRAVYSIIRNIPFSTFIVLPFDFKRGSNIILDYIIEDSRYKKSKSSGIYTVINLLLIAKIQ